MTWRDMSNYTSPLYEQLDIQLSKFHREFLESVDTRKISSNPTTKLLAHYQEKKESPTTKFIPDTVEDMMSDFNAGFDKGSPEYKFISVMENNDAGYRKRAEEGIRYLKNYAPKPQNESTGGSRFDFFLYLKDNFGVQTTLKMYSSNLDMYGDKWTIAYGLAEGKIEEEECDIELLKSLHENVSIPWRSTRVVEEIEDEQAESKNEPIPRESEEDTVETGYVTIGIGDIDVTGYDESDALHKISKNVNSSNIDKWSNKKDADITDCIPPSNIDTYVEPYEVNLEIEYAPEETIITYGSIRVIEETITKALQRVSLELNNQHQNNTNNNISNGSGNSFI